MQTMKSRVVLDRYIREGGIDQHFSTSRPNFLLFHYQAGELLTSPFSPSEYLQFLVEGSVRLYVMPDESSTVTLTASFHEVRIIGEMELVDASFTPFFVEAVTDVYAVALHIGQHREKLMQDPAFLRLLCVSLASKLRASTAQSERLPLKERVRHSLLCMEPGQRFTDIKRLSETLNVSNRQLLRVLKDYCESGVLEHEKKGVYLVRRKPM